jgi:hypothetical protein
MTEYVCYKVKIINPDFLLKTMLTEGTIRAEIFDVLEKYHMKCEDIIINEYECEDEKLVGEAMTPAEYRARRGKKKNR